MAIRNLLDVGFRGVTNEIDRDGMSVVAEASFASGRIAFRLLLLKYWAKSSIKAPGHIA